MNVNLRGRLDHCWTHATTLLPGDLHDRLKLFLTSVEAVGQIEKQNVTLASGEIVPVTPERCEAMFFYDRSTDERRGMIFIRKDNARLPEIQVIATFLHELAHAAFHMEDHPRVGLLSRVQAEAAAWMQAATWAVHGAVLYKHPHQLAAYCLKCAEPELRHWHPLTAKDIRAAILYALAQEEADGPEPWQASS